MLQKPVQLGSAAAAALHHLGLLCRARIHAGPCQSSGIQILLPDSSQLKMPRAGPRHWWGCTALDTTWLLLFSLLLFAQLWGSSVPEARGPLNLLMENLLSLKHSWQGTAVPPRWELKAGPDCSPRSRVNHMRYSRPD